MHFIRKKKNLKDTSNLKQEKYFPAQKNWTVMAKH